MATNQKKKKPAKKPSATQTSQEKGKQQQAKPNRLSKEEAARLAEMEENRKERAREKRKYFSEQYMPYILGALGFLLAFFFIAGLFVKEDSPVGSAVNNFFFGLFGWTAFLIPLFLAYLTIFWRKGCREGTIVTQSVLTVVLLFLLSAVIHVFVCYGAKDAVPADFDIGLWWNDGASFGSGGVIGGMLGWLLSFALHKGGTIAVSVVVFPLLIMVLIGVTPAYVAMKIKEKIQTAREEREERDIEAARDALDRPKKPEDKPRRQVKSAPTDDDRPDRDDRGDRGDRGDRSERDADDDQDAQDEEYQPPKKPQRKPSRQRDDNTTVRVDTTTGEVIEDQDDGQEVVPPESKPQVTDRKPADRHTDDRHIDDRHVDDRHADDTQDDEDDGEYVPPVRRTHRDAEQRPDTRKPEPRAQETSRDEEADDDGEELYIPERPTERDKRARRERERQRQVQTQQPVYEDEEYYADDLPEDTDTMEVSMDEEDDAELTPPRRKQTVTRTTQEEAPPERERIVVVVHEQDRTAVTSTSTNHVDGLAEEEVVLPSGGGEIADEVTNEYCFPPIDLMVRGSDRYEADEDEITRNIDTLRDVLESFHIRVKEVACSCGPTITRYEVKPDQGVRVRSIANLVDDIAMGLAKSGVRIEAPIPGKAAVGIEVPNEHPATVYLRNLIETPEFRGHKSPIAACLGADVSGRPVIFDINKMPHLLVAGATGMGKSVCINSIIMSILYKATPDEVKLILIDPKKVEFTMYRDLPHLYAPIVSDPKKAAGCLNSAVNEMERRFELIEQEGVRNIAGYNEVIADDPTKQPMPRIVIIIDEFADLMMTASQEVETAVCRLAQKARAAGIHLIIGTQRPSVDVITGLIKANIPSRIAFTVASARDSMTILDMGGADKLIGRGDMLYAPVGASKPMRVQGTFVSDSEVERVVTYIKEHNREVAFDEGFVKDIELEAAKCGNTGKKKGGDTSASDFDALGGGDEGDEKYWAAVEVAVEAQKISTSLLQRRLNLGYGRAAKIIDRMEEMGFVGPADGNKPRKLLITKQDLAEIRISGRTETEGE